MMNIISYHIISYHIISYHYSALGTYKIVPVVIVVLPETPFLPWQHYLYSNGPRLINFSLDNSHRLIFRSHRHRLITKNGDPSLLMISLFCFAVQYLPKCYVQGPHIVGDCCSWVLGHATHALQGFVISSTRLILHLPRCQWSNSDEYGWILQIDAITTDDTATTKQSTTNRRSHFMEYRLLFQYPIRHLVERSPLNSQSREIYIVNCAIALTFDMCFCSITTETLVKLQSDTIISITNLAASLDLTSYILLHGN